MKSALHQVTRIGDNITQIYTIFISVLEVDLHVAKPMKTYEEIPYDKYYFIRLIHSILSLSITLIRTIQTMILVFWKLITNPELNSGNGRRGNIHPEAIRCLRQKTWEFVFSMIKMRNHPTLPEFYNVPSSVSYNIHPRKKV